jgi:uncharacterized protein
MTQPNWREAVIAYIRKEALPVEKYGHQPRLYALACQVGEDMTCDDDVVFAAAWMHDLGVFTGHRPEDERELAGWDHIPYTVARTRELLAQWGFPLTKIGAVEEAIRTHQPHDDPRTVEGIVLHDADILEQLGAVGFARALAKIGRDTRYPTFSQVVPVLRRALEEFPGKLRTERARALAEPRIAVLRAFLAALEAEAGDRLF